MSIILTHTLYLENHKKKRMQAWSSHKNYNRQTAKKVNFLLSIIPKMVC